MDRTHIRIEDDMDTAEDKYFIWEDTGRNLTRELINFKFRVSKFLPKGMMERVSDELDTAVDFALTSALNFEQLEDYNNMNEIFDGYAMTNYQNKQA